MRNKYDFGDMYPILKGVISYSGSVDTDSMTATIEPADGSPPFTGPVIRTGGDSENNSLSTFEWAYQVLPADSDPANEGVYDLCLKVTHFDGRIETVNANITVEVGPCVPQ